jgi:CHASE2 domain-containing sensor protein
MTALFGAALFIGFSMLLIWIAASMVAGSVDGHEHQDPEKRFGVIGRSVMSGVFGFGMAGLSSLYAGWPVPLVFVSAVFGAVALIGVGIWLGPSQVE